MKAVVVGAKVSAYDFKDSGGRQVSGVSSEISLVKAKPSAEKGFVGRAVETYKSDIQVAERVVAALQVSQGAWLAADVDLTDKGKGANKSVVIESCELMGVLGVDYVMGVDGFVQPPTRAPVAVPPRAASAPQAARQPVASA